MYDKDTKRKELKIALKNWEMEINQLQALAEKPQAGKNDIEVQAMMEILKQKMGIIDQYLKHIEIEDNQSWEKKTAELVHMLKDIGDTYRKSLTFFY